jgi:tripartite-type tricarboxylate transporter receptor subunit TctC
MQYLPKLIVALACGLLALGASGAHADDYPSKPVHLLVGYGPGGAVDIVSRIIGEKLSKRLGQNIVVENKPGGGTLIALSTLAQAAPDGYTMMMADIALGAAPALHKRLPYNTFKDFDPVVLVALLPGVMAIDSKLPIKSVADFVKLAKSKPGKLNYASSGVGSLGHLGPELFKAESGTDIVQIPYHSGAEATQALLAGTVEMMMGTAPPLLPFKTKVHILAISNDKRLPILPDVPTFAESGYPGVQVQLWEGLFVPHGTDKKIIEKMNHEVNEVIALPEVRERIAKLGGQIVGGTPEQLNTFLKKEVAKWTKVVPESFRAK